MMKILIVHYRHFNTGGPERYLFNVSRALRAAGHEVINFSIKNSRNEPSPYSEYFVDNIDGSDEVFVDKLKKTPRTYATLMAREFYSPKVKRRLKRLINDTNPDICYLLAYKRALSPSVIDACAECGVPIVNRLSDYNAVCGSYELYRDGVLCELCTRGNDIHCLRHSCMKGSRVFSLVRFLSMKFQDAMRFSRKISHFVCTNAYMLEMMERRGYDPERLHVIRTFFHETPGLKADGRALPPLVGSPLRMLYIGNINESKGIYDLIGALKIVKERSSGFRLTVVGGLHSEEVERMLRAVEREGLKDFVEFVPFRSDGKVHQYYLDNHLTVLPARWPENLPNTLVESLYFHRPVVVPRHGSFLSTTNSDVAYYYDSHSQESLARTISDVIDHMDGLKDKSDKCAAFFEENYSEAKHMDALLRLFEETVRRNEAD